LLHKNPEECSSHLLCSASLKSCTSVMVYSRYSQHFYWWPKTVYCTGLVTQRVSKPNQHPTETIKIIWWLGSSQSILRLQPCVWESLV